jgi:hypothetical protein
VSVLIANYAAVDAPVDDYQHVEALKGIIPSEPATPIASESVGEVLPTIPKRALELDESQVGRV